MVELDGFVYGSIKVDGAGESGAVLGYPAGDQRLDPEIPDASRSRGRAERSRSAALPGCAS
ncbi:hypothetical protein [Streptomyces sp. NPDC059468]|uniref:hypothetical protein n=1 Tax=unclassified Streptomyces TaxID=2593676 RepID=UPI00367E48C7